MALYGLSRERFSRTDHLHSLHNILLALDLIASLVVAGYGGCRRPPPNNIHPVCLGPLRLHHRDLKLPLVCFSVFGGKFIHDLSVLGIFFRMPDRYCPKCHASIHRSQKKRSRPFAQKPICWLVKEPSIHHNTNESAPGDLGGGDGLAHARTTLSRVQALLTGDNSLGLLDDLLGLGKDELDVAGVGHVGVDLDHICQNKCSSTFGTCRLR